MTGRRDHLRQHRAAGNVEIGVEHEGDGIAFGGKRNIAVHGRDAAERGAEPASRLDDPLAHLDPARGDSAGIAAEIAGAEHELHRQAEGRGARDDFGIDGFEIVEQRRPGIPGHRRRAVGDIVAGQRRDRNDGGFGESEALGHGAKFRLDLLEALLRPAHLVHLVDGQHHAFDADEIADRGVTAGLALDAVAGVDQEDGDIGMGGARRHVARVLLVPGKVDDDEAAVRRLEITPSDVDGDALLALGLEPVEQEAEIDPLAVDAATMRGKGHRRALILGDARRVP